MQKGVRANGHAISEMRKERAIKLIKQGLSNALIAERLGWRTDSVNRVRKEVEASADRGS